jgi:hypothetical protein
VLVVLAGCGGDSEGLDNAEQGSNGQAAATSSAEEQGNSENSEHFTRENWDMLAGDPDGHKGATVDVIGKIFLPPERDEDGVYFQMYADPSNSEFNTVVASRDRTLRLSEEDYVHVTGTLGDAYEGENAFGAELNVPVVIADTVEVVDATAAAPPAVGTLGVAKYASNGLSVIVDKVEFAETETRVFLTVDNQSGSDFNFYSSSTKALQGTNQYEPELFAGDYPEVPSEIVAGAKVSGVIVLPEMDPAGGLELRMEGTSDNSEIGEYGTVEWKFTWE